MTQAFKDPLLRCRRHQRELGRERQRRPADVWQGRGADLLEQAEEFFSGHATRGPTGIHLGGLQRPRM